MGYFRGTSRSAPGEWADVELTAWLNQLLGTNIRPWELGEAPDVWLDVIVMGYNLKHELGESGLLKR